MKKKILYFGILIFVFLGIILLLNDNSLILNTAGDIMVEEEQMPIGMAIFCEMFVTIHMSVFVLFPLAKIINRNKSMPVFITLFCIRIVILIIGDIINPGVMMFIDFFSVFFGAFIVVPVLMFLKGAIFGGDLGYHEYVEVDARKLNLIGYSDIELLKRVLTELYIDIKRAFSEGDRKKLIELCSKHKFILYKNELELLEKVDEKKVFDKFEIIDSKILDVFKNDKEINVTMLLKLSFLDYTVDRFNKVINGSDRIPNEQLLELVFHKTLQHEMVDECPNCGSPITKGGIEFCSYCGSELNFNIGEFVLKNERIIKK